MFSGSVQSVEFQPVPVPTNEYCSYKRLVFCLEQWNRGVRTFKNYIFSSAIPMYVLCLRIMLLLFNRIIEIIYRIARVNDAV